MAHIPTRTPQECAELANRQRAGEDLGFSQAFVDEWATAPAAKKAAAPKKPTAAKEEPAPKKAPAEKNAPAPQK